MVQPFTALGYSQQTKKPSKAERTAVEKRRRELLDEKQTFDARKVESFQNELNRQRSKTFYENFNKRMDAAGPSAPPVQYRDTLSESRLMDGPQLRAVAPGEDDPMRAPKAIADTTPRGADLSKPAVPEGPSLAVGMGAGGPEQPVDPERPWLNDPVVGQEPQSAQAKADRPWANDPIVGEEPQPRKPTGDINDLIDEAANMIPGGYGNWAIKEGLAVADPLSKEGYTYKSQVRQLSPLEEMKGLPDGDYQRGPDGKLAPVADKEWNENLADILQAGADFIMEPLNSRDAGGDDPVGEAAKMFVGGTANLPAALARDPGQTIAYDYNPIYQIGMGYKSLEDAGGDAIEGNFDTAGQKALRGASEIASGALAFTPLKGRAGRMRAGTTTLAEAKRAAVDTSAGLSKPLPVQQSGSAVPSVKQAGRTLAATAVPGRRMRPQALKAIERILVASNVPRDRIGVGLTRINDALPGFASGEVAGSARAPTVAQLIEREFGKEFPEVAQNLRTVLLERRLTKTRKDISPTIVRDAAQEMRGSQVPFLQESAAKNLGDTARTSTRADVEANLKQIGEEGYSPIVKQPATPERAKAIQDVLNGPGMNELGRPLRQIAAGEGIDIETMIAQRPIEAAHWMQHKARLLAEENSGTTLGNAYNAMRSRILGTIDDLKTPDGETYAQVRAKYGDEAGIKDALTAGDRFGAIVRNPDGANQFIDKFNEATPEQQAAQLASIRDWTESKLRGGGEEGASRLTELQSIAVLDTLDRLGPQGKALADDIRAVRDEERFLGGFYPKSESATANNLTAIGQGADIYSRPGASSMPTNAMADAALMASGFSSAPILTAMRQGPKLYRGIMQPKVATREDMTRILMSRPKSRQAARSAARPEVTTPKVRPAPAAPNTGLGTSSPPASVSRSNEPLPAPSGMGEWSGPKPEKPQSLVTWLKQQGGIDDTNYMSGDLQAIMGRHNGMPGLLNRKSGKGLDDLTSAAYHQGFDVDPDDPNSLMRLIDEEFSGDPSYRIGAREEWDIYQEWLRAKQENGFVNPTLLAPVVGGGLGYMAAPEDKKAEGAILGAIGGTALGYGATRKLGKPKPPGGPASKAPPRAPVAAPEAPRGPAAPVSAMPESMRLASARLKDGSTQDVVADVFTDRGVVVVSPSWPTNAGNDLADALVSRSNELRSPRKGFKVVDENYAPKVPREPSAKWSSQNPQEMGDLTKQVADRFIGLSRTGDAHVLALTNEVDLNSLASYLEANIPSSKQLVATRDGGEIAIVSKRWLRDNGDRFSAPTWEPLYPSYNQENGLRPAPAEWAKPKPPVKN